MPDPNKDLVTLLSVPNNLEAAMVVSALAARGIDATTTGSFTSGFQAEAPGVVLVSVRSCDLAQAEDALQEIRSQADATREDATCEDIAAEDIVGVDSTGQALSDTDSESQASKKQKIIILAFFGALFVAYLLSQL